MDSDDIPPRSCLTIPAGYCAGCYLVVPLALYAGAPVWFAVFAPVTVPLYFVVTWWLVGNPELPVDTTRVLLQAAGWAALIVAGIGAARMVLTRQVQLWPLVALVAGQTLLGVTVLSR
jgi:hypothetical protein